MNIIFSGVLLNSDPEILYFHAMRYLILIILLSISLLVFLAGGAMRIMHWPMGMELYWLGLASACLVLVLIVVKALRSKKPDS